MYITYVSRQKSTDSISKRCWLDAVGGTYRPRFLIRVSDWEKVPGDQAVNGYCTVSYSWEQSGELKTTADEEIHCIDEGRHRLITATESVIHKTRRATRSRRHSTLTYVSFTGILKQICKDFQIEYLWYDKDCINQRNREEKLHDISQMHRIYSNARFTVALIPEIRVKKMSAFKQVDPIFHIRYARKIALDTIRESSWWKRSWTLEELMVSKNVLIVGTNAHVWAQTPRENYLPIIPDFLTSMLNSQNMDVKSANQVFRFAQFRTSSKEHDKIFALLNVFQGTISMETSYTSNILDTVRSFYRKLVEHDLSIMCFGSVRDPSWNIFYQSTFASYNLPSWTGNSGRHLHNPVEVTIYSEGAHFTDSAMGLHIKCKYFTIRPNQFTDTTFYLEKERSIAVSERMKAVDYNVNAISSGDPIYIDILRWEMQHLANCIATHLWESSHDTFYPATPLSLTEDCEEATVPSIIYDNRSMIYLKAGSGCTIQYQHTYFLPVMKKSRGSAVYKAVGIMLLKTYTGLDGRDDPLEYLKRVFDGCSGGFKEIIII